MMRTWSIEELFSKAYSAVAVAVQGVLDAFGTIERITRPPRRSILELLECSNCGREDCRDPYCRGGDGAEQLADKEAEEECWEARSRCELGAEVCARCCFWTEGRPLTDDELVAVRGLIQERYETSADEPRIRYRLGPAEQDAEWTSPSGIVWSFDCGAWQWRYPDAYSPSWRAAAGNVLPDYQCKSYGPFTETSASVINTGAGAEPDESVDEYMARATRVDGGYLISPAVSGDPAGVSPSEVDPFPRDPSEGRSDERASCRACHGAGHHHLECIRCKGTGVEPSPRSTWSDLAERMSNHLPSAKAERPTSELLIQAADGLEAIIRDGKYRWNFDALIRELRDRAATFKAIEE
jgi:hypothetical protein